MLVPCEFCGHDVDPKVAGTHQFVEGWRPRQGTAVRAVTEHPRYACRPCVDLRHAGHVRTDQPGLF